jgi:hypothetical protein
MFPLASNTDNAALAVALRFKGRECRNELLRHLGTELATQAIRFLSAPRIFVLTLI